VRLDMLVLLIDVTGVNVAPPIIATPERPACIIAGKRQPYARSIWCPCLPRGDDDG
jgi:hypothetical protein